MFEKELTSLRDRHLLRALRGVEASDGVRLTMDGRSLLSMCSNDYLGLARHAALVEAAHAALDADGLGAGASRLVSGNSPVHRALEDATARFKQTEAALLMNSGYAANTGCIPALAHEGDLLFSDALNHASIIDGCRLSRADCQVYRHGDLEHLESLLSGSHRARRRLIVTDGVFSMDGDIAPLPGLVALAERYDALLIVDDAHATGVLGRSGRGTSEYFCLHDRIAVQMGTFSKALGSFGAYVAGERSLIDYLVNTARSFIYSTALPPAVCAASIAALQLVESGQELRDALQRNVYRLREGLRALDMDIPDGITPIIPVVVGDANKTLLCSRRLLELGLYAVAIRPPTVPEGTARIRLTVTAAHSPADIDHSLAAFRTLREEGLL